jgi:hypothetical protein
MHNEKCRTHGNFAFCTLHFAFRLRFSAAC